MSAAPISQQPGLEQQSVAQPAPPTLVLSAVPSAASAEPPPPYQEKMSTNNVQDPSWFSTFTGQSAAPPGSPLDGGLATGDGPGQGASGFSAQAALSWLAERRRSLRAWTEFFRTAKFGLPPGLAAVAPRLQHNLAYFLSNYLCVFILLLVYCILTSFVMLLALVALGGLIYTVRQRTLKGPVIVGGHELPTSLLYTLAVIVCIPLFAMADVGNVMYWVVGSSIFLIFLHATLYESEEVPGSEFEVVTVQ